MRRVARRFRFTKLADDLLRCEPLPAHAPCLLPKAPRAQSVTQTLDSFSGGGRSHDGEHLDFHSLRHTCGAWLAMTGARPKAVQAVMRHSTITLTMDTYGHLFPGQEAETVGQFPAMLGAHSDALRATGTTDAAAVPGQNVQQHRHQYCEQLGRDTAHAGATARGEDTNDKRPRGDCKSLPDREIRNAPQDSARRCDDRHGGPPAIRTPDPLIKSRPASLRNAFQNKDLRVSSESPSAPLQRAAEEALPAPDMPPDLAQVAAAWRGLPPAIRAGIVAMVDAAK